MNLIFTLYFVINSTCTCYTSHYCRDGWYTVLLELIIRFIHCKYLFRKYRQQKKNTQRIDFQFSEKENLKRYIMKEIEIHKNTQ